MTDFNRISVVDAKKLIDDETVLIVDIRDERSYAMGRIPSAMLIDNSNVQQFINENELTTTLIVCCYHGNMSQSGASFFAQEGFEKVYSLDGGFTDWARLYPDQVER